MNYHILNNFLEQKANSSDHFRNLLQELIATMEKNMKLNEELKALNGKHAKLSMDNFTLERICEQRADDSEQIVGIVSQAHSAYESYIEFSAGIKSIDMSKLAAFDAQQEYLHYRDEIAEIQRQHNRKKAMYEAMEKRNIVQKLRREQAELIEIKAQLEHGKILHTNTFDIFQRKMNHAINLRNKSVLYLVKSSKELQKHNEKKFKGNCTQQSNKMQLNSSNMLNISLMNKSANENATATSATRFTFAMPPPQCDAFATATNFIKEANMPPTYQNATFLEYFTDLQINKEFNDQNESNKTANETGLRSILRRPSNEGADDVSKEKISKSVYLLVSESSICSSSSNSSSSPNSAAGEMMSFDYSIEKVKIDMAKIEENHMADDIAESDVETETIDLITQTPESPEYEPITARAVVNATEQAQQRTAIEIQDCRTIKPAGTPLPQKIPLEFSPATERVLNAESIAKEKDVFKVPAVPVAKRNLQTKFAAENMCIAQAEEDNKPSCSHKSKRSKKRQNFESMLLSAFNDDVDDDGAAEDGAAANEDSNIFDAEDENNTLGFSDVYPGMELDKDDDKFTIHFSDEIEGSGDDADIYDFL